jgi:serine/threonine protein phosphatase 1
MQSREVIDLLMGELVSPFETYFLKGNHEAAMLQFLTDPTIGPRWSEFGGRDAGILRRSPAPDAHPAVNEDVGPEPGLAA